MSQLYSCEFLSHTTQVWDGLKEAPATCCYANCARRQDAPSSDEDGWLNEAHLDFSQRPRAQRGRIMSPKMQKPQTPVLSLERHHDLDLLHLLQRSFTHSEHLTASIVRKHRKLDDDHRVPCVNVMAFRSLGSFVALQPITVRGRS